MPLANPWLFEDFQRGVDLIASSTRHERQLLHARHRNFYTLRPWASSLRLTAGNHRPSSTGPSRIFRRHRVMPTRRFMSRNAWDRYCLALTLLSVMLTPI